MRRTILETTERRGDGCRGRSDRLGPVPAPKARGRGDHPRPKDSWAGSKCQGDTKYLAWTWGVALLAQTGAIPWNTIAGTGVATAEPVATGATPRRSRPQTRQSPTLSLPGARRVLPVPRPAGHARSRAPALRIGFHHPTTRTVTVPERILRATTLFCSSRVSQMGSRLAGDGRTPTGNRSYLGSSRLRGRRVDRSAERHRLIRTCVRWGTAAWCIARSLHDRPVPRIPTPSGPQRTAGIGGDRCHRCLRPNGVPVGA